MAEHENFRFNYYDNHELLSKNFWQIRLHNQGDDLAEYWYAIHSKANCEEVLSCHLTAQGLETYYPCLHINPVNSRARTVKPYFPGYLFVKVDLEKYGFTKLQYGLYVKHLVCYGTEPIQVNEGLIALIRAKLEINNRLENEFESTMKSGTRIKILDGLFEGYEAIFEGRTGHGRVRVMLNLLNNQGLWLEIYRNKVQAIDKN